MLPWWFPNLRQPLSSLLLSKTLIKLFYKEVFIKFTKFRRRLTYPGEIVGKVKRIREFLSSMGEYNRFAVEECRQTLSYLVDQGITKVSVYGVNEIAEILYDLSFELSIEIIVIYDECPRKKPWAPPVLSLNDYQNSQGPIIIAAVIGVEEKVWRLSRLGIDVQNFVLMGQPHEGLLSSGPGLRFVMNGETLL